MPVREKSEQSVQRHIAGNFVFNGLIQQCTSVPHKDYELVEEFVNNVYALVIQSIDWPRILIESEARHYRACEQDGEHADSAAQADVGLGRARDFCTECLEEALLTYDPHSIEISWNDETGRINEDPDNAPHFKPTPRGWFMPDELQDMFIKWLKTRKASINAHLLENKDDE